MNSTRTRRSARAEAALATVRIALATRPPLPISLPRSSPPTVISSTRSPFSSTSETSTESGSSTSARARNSTSSRMSLSARRLDALGAKQSRHGAGRLGAMGEPVLGALRVDHDRRGIGLRVVVPDRLDRPAVARRAAVGDDDAPDRVLSRPDSSEPDSYGHLRRTRLHAPQQLLWVGHLALRELGHQLAHLPELLDELVHGLHGRPGASGDSLAPGAVDQIRPRALGGRHREDARLDPVELAS